MASRSAYSWSSPATTSFARAMGSVYELPRGCGVEQARVGRQEVGQGVGPPGVEEWRLDRQQALAQVRPAGRDAVARQTHQRDPVGAQVAQRVDEVARLAAPAVEDQGLAQRVDDVQDAT